jgi:hypothetical protein
MYYSTHVAFRRSTAGKAVPRYGGDGSRGVVVRSMSDWNFNSVSDAGDVNGDGIDDLFSGYWCRPERRTLSAELPAVPAGRRAFLQSFR